MKTILGATVPRIAVLSILCAILTGCGAIPSYQAVRDYRTWQSGEVAKQLSDCLDEKTSLAKAGKVEEAKAQDCFLTMVDSSTRRLDSAGRVPGSPLPNEPDVAKPASLERYPALALDGARSAEEVVSQVAWMAMLSKVVYRRHVDESMRNLPENACDFKGHPLERLNAAIRIDANIADSNISHAAPTQNGRWVQWMKIGANGRPVGCLAEGGLFYESFVYRTGLKDPNPGSITHAVIVFRGTEAYGDQMRQDWSSNLAAPFNRTPAQFKVVRQELPRLVDELTSDSEGGKSLKIYTAGHSLGGGLAQLAAYMSNKVIAAYAFNTSPVTGWTWLQGLKKEDPKALAVEDPQVVRVSQDDEALSVVRLFTNAANTTVRRSGRTDVVFDFPSSRAVVAASKPRWGFSAGAELHSITLLACNLAARVATYTNGGAFSYRPEMAKRAISEIDGVYTSGGSNVEGLCQVKIKNIACSLDWMSNAASCSVDGVMQSAKAAGTPAKASLD